MPETVNILCMNCGEPSYLSEEEASAWAGCDKCGHAGVPADLDESVTVTLTAHELRILSYWAEGYAKLSARLGWDLRGTMPNVLKTIRDRLSMQTTTPLSLSQEMADMRAHFAQEHGTDVNMLIIDDDGTCVECGRPVDLANLTDHVCGLPEVTDEHGTETDQDAPPAL